MIKLRQNYLQESFPQSSTFDDFMKTCSRTSPTPVHTEFYQYCGLYSLFLVFQQQMTSSSATPTTTMRNIRLNLTFILFILGCLGWGVSSLCLLSPVVNCLWCSWCLPVFLEWVVIVGTRVLTLFYLFVPVLHLALFTFPPFCLCWLRGEKSLCTEPLTK